MTDLIPVTVLTGFLGSGKTTLLNRILTEQHGRKIAVIENEFGEIGIDHNLVIGADEEVFEMNNGCICCTVRGDLIRILGNLVRRRDRIEHVLVETTGLADPSPVAQTFFVDEDVRGRFRLDGIVTMVDAKHVVLHLDDSDECKQQVAFGDVIVLNKTDLVSAEELDALERRIRGMNALARIHRTVRAELPIASVLDVGGFDLARALETRPTFLDPEYPFEWVGIYALEAGKAELVLAGGADETMAVHLVPVRAADADQLRAASERCVRSWSREQPVLEPGARFVAGEQAHALTLHPGSSEVLHYGIDVPVAGLYALVTEHLPSELSRFELVQGERTLPALVEVEHTAGHSHDEQVTSVGLRDGRPVDATRLNAWLSELLREKGADLYRMKGILNVHGSPERFVFQGVHMLFDATRDRPWKPGEARTSEIVFIGKDLDRNALREGFARCLVD
ncbi:MAG: GTP-binding protein [Sandaracinaceae bacterium]